MRRACVLVCMFATWICNSNLPLFFEIVVLKKSYHAFKRKRERGRGRGRGEREKKNKNPKTRRSDKLLKYLSYLFGRKINSYIYIKLILFLLHGIGMVLVYLAGCYLHWRTVAWLSIGIAVIPLLMMYLFTPESPTWLVSQGRNQEALKACKVVSLDKEKVRGFRILLGLRNKQLVFGR